MAIHKRRLFPLHKRWAALLLALILIMANTAALAAEFAVVYNTDRLNLRKEPNSGSTKLGSYSPGTWVEISTAPGNWYAVITPDGKTGYMSRNYLNAGITGYTTIATVLNPKPTQFLNLRKDPSYNAQVLGIYYDGTPALFLDEDNGWYHVSVDGTLGYFRSEFVKLDVVLGSDDIATIVTPNNTGLNLREGPGMQYPSIRQFKGGRYVMVLNRGDGWWKVSIDGYQGYMNTDFLQEGILISGSSGGQSPGQPYALVKNPKSTQILYLREEPSLNSNVLGQYKNGTRLTVLSQGSEWSYVNVDSTGKIGYMQSDYLSFCNLPAKNMLTVTHPDSTFVNLRNGPSLTGTKILARMQDGAQVEVLIPGTDWIKVRYGQITGYALSAFMK